MPLRIRLASSMVTVKLISFMAGFEFHKVSSHRGEAPARNRLISLRITDSVQSIRSGRWSTQLGCSCGVSQCQAFAKGQIGMLDVALNFLAAELNSYFLARGARKPSDEIGK